MTTSPREHGPSGEDRFEAKPRVVLGESVDNVAKPEQRDRLLVPSSNLLDNFLAHDGSALRKSIANADKSERKAVSERADQTPDRMSALKNRSAFLIETRALIADLQAQESMLRAQAGIGSHDIGNGVLVAVPIPTSRPTRTASANSKQISSPTCCSMQGPTGTATPFPAGSNTRASALTPMHS